MLMSALAVVAAVGVVLTTALLFRKLGRGADDHDPGGATAGHAGAMLSALFLLVFAIAVIVPWTTADSARQNTYAESQALVETYWAAAALPAPAGAQVQADLRAYVRVLVGSEWTLMKHGRVSPEATARLDGIRTEVMSLRPGGSDGKDAQTAVLDHLQDVSAARAQRTMDASSRPPMGVLYLSVLLGVIVAVFPFLAGARPRGTTIVPLAVTAALLGFGIYLAFDISHVFSGALKVKPDAYTSAQQEFQRVPEGG